jgi:hypothetical protein
MPAPEIEALRAQLDRAVELARDAPARPSHELLDMVEEAGRLLRAFMAQLGELRAREATFTPDDRASLLALTLEAKASAPLFDQAAKAAERAADKPTD